MLGGVVLPKLSLQWKAVGRGCANPECRPSSMLNSLGRKREAIRIGEEWYCSADCFEEAAHDRLAQLCRVDIPAEAQRRFRVPLGLLLLSRGVINNQQLQTALGEQRVQGGRIGEILMNRGDADEEQVTAGVAAQWGYPVFSMRNRFPETAIALPYSLLEWHSVLPVHYLPGKNKLMIGFVYQIDHSLLAAIEHMTGTATEPCFVIPSDFNSGIRGLATAFKNEEVSFDRVTSVLEMARIVRNYSVQVGAEAACFSRLRNYVWCRVEGPRQQIELFFKLPGR